MLESDTFNHKMSSSPAKHVQCSPAHYRLFLRQKNILQQINHLFGAFALAPTALDRMNRVIIFKFVKLVNDYFWCIL